MNYNTLQERRAKNLLLPKMDFWEERDIARQKKEDRNETVYHIGMSAMFIGLLAFGVTIMILR